MAGAAGGPKGLVLNPLDRFDMGVLLERVVFSSPREAPPLDLADELATLLPRASIDALPLA